MRTLFVLACLLELVQSIRIDPATAAQARLEREQDEDYVAWMQQQQQQTTTQSSSRILAHRRLSSASSAPTTTNPDDHLVTSLPLWKGDPFPTQHWAGHLPASASDDKYFFYWLFAPEASDDANVPLLIWLNGGPGCSSMDGLFLENGPFELTKDDSGSYFVTPREYSWHKVPAYTIYIDQPVGTGLSFTKSHTYPENDEEVNVDFYYFLQQLLKLHADKFIGSDGKTTNRPIYFSGESHAGHYIPHMMRYILAKNDDDLKDGEYSVQVGGAAIGNGWTDPYNQYSAAEAAYGHGLVGQAQVNALAKKEAECQQSLSSGRYSNSVCFALLDDIVKESFGSKSAYKVSQYDANLSELKYSPRHFPPGHKVVEAYLGGWKLKDDDGTLNEEVYTDVLQALHATAAEAAKQRYQECTDPPYNALSHQDGKGVIQDVVQVLEHKDNVRFLFFNGMNDLICNHVGNEKFLTEMKWKGRDQWIKADRYVWTAESEEDGMVSGYMKEYGNLLFLKLLRCGHMVPLDIPDKSLDMMRTFLQSKSFKQDRQNLGTSSEKAGCPACDSSSSSSCPTCPAAAPSSGDSPSCPECEPCPDVTETAAGAPPGEDQSQVGVLLQDRGSIFSFGILIGGVIVSICAGTLIACQNPNSAMHIRPTTRNGHSSLHQYDVEMRETHYTDSPGNGAAAEAELSYEVQGRTRID